MKNLQLIIFSLIFFLFSFINSTQNYPNNENKDFDIQTGQFLTEVGEWQAGPYSEAAVDEIRDYVFLSSGGKVLIFDISIITDPVLVNQSISTSGKIIDMYFNSITQDLYVTLGENGVEIWDVADVNSPQFLSGLLLDYAGTTPPATRMAVKPGFLFIAAEYGGIATINVSDPENPFQSGGTIGTGGTKYAVSLSEDGSKLVANSLSETELYIVNSDGTLTLINVGQPLYGAWESHIKGNYSFQILQATLYVLDLTQNGLPVVASYSLPGNAASGYCITDNNDLLYITDPFYGLEIFNVQNPINPVLLGSIETNCSDVVYYNKTNFVPDVQGMKTIDVSDSTNPVIVNTYEGPGGSIRDVEVAGSYCFLHSFHNFNIIDISNPAEPFLVGNNQPSDGFDRKFILNGNYAYIANSEEGLRVVDISDPVNPVTVGYNNEASYSRLAAEGNYLYATDHNHKLNVLDISNPVSPLVIGSITLYDFSSNIVVKDGFVYLAQYDFGLLIVDATDPTQPVLASEYSQNVDVWGVDVKNNYAYISDIYAFYNRVKILDISDTNNPLLVGEYIFDDPPPQARDVFVYEDVLFVLEQTNPYVTALDISDPEQPFEIDHQLIPDISYDLSVTDDYIFIATEQAGLHIYDNPFTPIPVELTSFTANVVDDKVKLEWTTATETNNSGFEVQRKRNLRGQQDVSGNSDLEGYIKVGFVEGNGTTTEAQTYSFVDDDLSNGKYQYRLKQIDYDGSFEYSDIVEIDINNIPDEFSLEQNYPNPFNPVTTINYSIPVDSKVSIKIYNTLGEKVAVLLNKEISAGNHFVNFNAQNLSSGTYFYRITASGNNGETYVASKKMIILK